MQKNAQVRGNSPLYTVSSNGNGISAGCRHNEKFPAKAGDIIGGVRPRAQAGERII